MTRRKPTAILLDPSPGMVRAAREAGARSLVLHSGPGDPTSRDAALSADDAMTVDWRDHPRLLDVLSHFADSPLRKPDGPSASVFGFGEAGALVAARANEALGLPGNPHAAVAYLTDKAALRDRVNQFAATPVRFERCDRAAALVPAAERVGFPCVVKPRTGSGGRDVLLLRDAERARALARQLAPEPALIVEEFLAGPEFAVAAHSVKGRHTVLAVMRKHTTGVPEFRAAAVGSHTEAGPWPSSVADGQESGYDTGYDVPASLDQRTAQRVHALVDATLTAAGHRTGPSHTDVVLTTRGPALIESHAHPGVERMNTLLVLATGADRYRQAVATTLDLPHPSAPTRRRHAAARLLPLSPRSLDDTDRARAAREVPGVVSVELGTSLGSHVPAATSRVAGHGVITAAGATPPEVARALHEAEHRLIPARATSLAEELSAV